jgi:N-acetylmuramoyl-L-alanine amidase
MKKRIITLLIILFVFIIINNELIYAEESLDFGLRVIKKGMEGVDVAILQRKLMTLSFYNGEIDGIFGSETEIAVKNFQKANNIKVDGIIGIETYKYLPKEGLFSRMNINRDDIVLLARIINGEARGESFKGKVAVGAVILNRVESDKFPDGIREVILQKGQFSCVIDGQANLYPSKQSLDAAKSALMGYDPTFGSLFFYNPKVATNLKWISSRPIVVRIGDHIFSR